MLASQNQVDAMVAAMNNEGLRFDLTEWPDQRAIDAHGAGMGPNPWPDTYWTCVRLLDAVLSLNEDA